MLNTTVTQWEERENVLAKRLILQWHWNACKIAVKERDKGRKTQRNKWLLAGKVKSEQVASNIHPLVTCCDGQLDVLVTSNCFSFLPITQLIHWHKKYVELTFFFPSLCHQYNDWACNIAVLAIFVENRRRGNDDELAHLRIDEDCWAGEKRPGRGHGENTCPPFAPSSVPRGRHTQRKRRRRREMRTVSEKCKMKAASCHSRWSG